MRIVSRAAGSMPEMGSSNRYTCARRLIANANCTFSRCPRDKLFSLRLGSIPNESTSEAARAASKSAKKSVNMANAEAVDTRSGR